MSADSGPGEREVAYRLFATEFDDADFSYSESDEERAPNYVVTPTGARLNRLFAVGVLTEVEPVSDDVLRGRIVDPTGAFVTYAGQYQPDAMAYLDRTDPPGFVAMTGKARTYQPDDSDRVFTSVRPESLNEVDAGTRDRWVVTAAEATLERIAYCRAALDSSLTGEELRVALLEAGASDSLAAGLPLAIDHYGTTEAYLAALATVATDALEVVAGERESVRPLEVAPDEPGQASFDALPAVGPLSVPDGAVSEPTPSATADADGAEADAVGTTAGATPTGNAPGETSGDDVSPSETTEATAGTDAEPSSFGTGDDVDAGTGTGTGAGAGAGVDVDEADEPAPATSEAEMGGTTAGTSTEAGDGAGSESTSGSPDAGATLGTGDEPADSRDESGPSDSASPTDVGSVDDAGGTGTAASGPAGGGSSGGGDAGGLGDFDDGGGLGGLDEDPATDPEPEPESGSGSASSTTDDPSGADQSGDAGDERFELDPEEREELAEEYGTDFETGTEVDDPGEADIDVPDVDEVAAEMEARDGSTTESSDDRAAAADPTSSGDKTVPETDEQPPTGSPDPGDTSEPAAATPIEDTTEETAPTATDAATESEDVAESTPESASATDDTDVDLSDVDLSAVAVEAMADLDDGDGAQRDAVVAAVVDEYGADPDAVEDAIQDALMSGQCYEPTDDRLKAI
jgi:hypothetical protein